MQSRRERGQEDLFVAGPLYDLVPGDHILRRIDAVVDFSWLHEEVRECYYEDNGRPSIDPGSALRLMLEIRDNRIIGDSHLFVDFPA